MEVGENEFLSRFYSDFLMLKAEVTLLRSLLLTHISDGDKEKMKMASGMLDEQVSKLFETIVSEVAFDDKTKNMIEEIKRRILCQ